MAGSMLNVCQLSSLAPQAYLPTRLPTRIQLSVGHSPGQPLQVGRRGPIASEWEHRRCEPPYSVIKSRHAPAG